MRAPLRDVRACIDRFDDDAARSNLADGIALAGEKEDIAARQPRDEALLDLADRAGAALTNGDAGFVRNRSDVFEERRTDFASEPVDRRIVCAEASHVRDLSAG